MVDRSKTRSGGIKNCSHCGAEFNAYRQRDKYCKSACRYQATASKHTPAQRSRRAENFRKWNRDNKDYRRNYQLNYMYGISLDKYYEILKTQNDCCAVCDKHISESKRLFAVDHDHKTGEIFGILCDYCNRQLIGRIRKPELFLRAAKYLSGGLGLYVPKKEKKRKRRKR